MADRKISDLTALTTPASGDYLPIVDISETAASSKNKRITIEELFRGVPLGTAAAPSIAIEGDEDTGIYSPGANQVALATGGTGRLFVDASGNVGVGTTSPGAKLQVNDTGTAAVNSTTNSGVNRVLISDASGTTTAGSGGAIDFEGVYGALGRIAFGKSDSATSGGGRDRGDFYILQNQNGGQDSYSAFYETLKISWADGLVYKRDNNEQFRVDTSGRLLVGTASSVGSGCQLQIAATSAVSLVELSRNNDDAFGGRLILSKGRGGTTIVNNNDNLGYIYFRGSDGVDLASTAASIEAYVDGTPGADDMPGRLVFSTCPSGSASSVERMRITQSGGVKIGTTSDTIDSTNFGTIIGSNSVGTPDVGLFRTSRNQTGVQVVIQAFGTAGQFRTMGDGDAENTNNSYGGLSDAKLKENIVDANSQWDDLKALQVRKYNFKAETGYSTHTQIGLVAQEVELVSPGLVGESIDEETGESTKSVNYSVLYMKAVKALQEAMERIETLEAKVAALETP